MPVATKPGKTLGTILFSGPPRRLAASGAVPDLTGASFEPGEALAGHVPERGRALRVRSRGRTGGPGAKLKLSQQTPPGSYAARIVADEGSYDAQIEVQPAMRVAVNPPELSFSGKPGARATFATTLSNMGNVPVTIPKTAPLGIFDDDGVETALSAAYGQKFEDVNDFFKTVIGRLNTAHGGVIKLVSTKGAGTHDPGATVLWEIEAEYPESLPRGHRFHGVWTTDFGNLAVSLFVEK